MSAIKKEIEKRMELLAEKTELTFDGGDDNRLFADDDWRIDVYAGTMSEEEWDAMTLKIDKFLIDRDAYSVYVWNDSGGYAYWKNEGGMNYIQITVLVTDIPEAEQDKEQIEKDVQTAYDTFCEYHNVEVR